MAPNACPPECELDRTRIKEDVRVLFSQSLPAWVRAILVSVIASIFVLLSTMAVYGLTTFATKKELETLREESRQTNQKIFEYLQSIDRKLERQ